MQRAAFFLESRMRFIHRELKYTAHRVKVYEDTLETRDHQILKYDYVENRNGAGVLPVDRDGNLILVRQYRNSVGREEIEIPAGCLEEKDYTEQRGILLENMKGERDFSVQGIDIRAFGQTALRECREETGYLPGRLIFLSYMIAAAGLFSERTAVFLGTDLQKTESSPDQEEELEVLHMSCREACEAVYTDRIHDSKTILAIQAFRQILENPESYHL